MFCIDDTKDCDDTNTGGKDDGLSDNRDMAFQEIDAAKDTAELSKKIFNKYTMLHDDKAFMKRLGERKKEGCLMYKLKKIGCRVLSGHSHLHNAGRQDA